MKRVILWSILLSLIISVSLPVNAAAETLSIPDLDLSLTVPADYGILSRDMPANDPLLSEFGFTYTDVMDYFNEAGIYLNLIAPDYIDEILVTKAVSYTNDLSELGDNSIMAVLGPLLEDAYQEAGAKVSSYDVYHSNNLTFLRIRFFVEKDSVYGLQYHTAYNGNALNFTYRSYGSPLTPSEEEIIQDLVDSIELLSYVPETVCPQETPAFLYTDEITGTAFTVPANWAEDAFYEDRNYWDEKFAFSEDPGLIILFGTIDLYEEMSWWQKILLGSYISDDMELSTEEIATMYDVPVSAIMKRVYGSEDYYLVEIPATTDFFGVSATITQTQATHFENGLMYNFAFNSTAENPHFSDFEQLLASVEYGDKNVSTPFPYGLLLLLIPAGVLIAVLLLRKKKHAKSSQAYIYCQMCGTRLPADSQFCVECGARLHRKGHTQ